MIRSQLNFRKYYILYIYIQNCNSLYSDTASIVSKEINLIEILKKIVFFLLLLLKILCLEFSQTKKKRTEFNKTEKDVIFTDENPERIFQRKDVENETRMVRV